MLFSQLPRIIYVPLFVEWMVVEEMVRLEMSFTNRSQNIAILNMVNDQSVWSLFGIENLQYYDSFIDWCIVRGIELRSAFLSSIKYFSPFLIEFDRVVTLEVNTSIVCKIRSNLNDLRELTLYGKSMALSPIFSDISTFAPRLKKLTLKDFTLHQNNETVITLDVTHLSLVNCHNMPLGFGGCVIKACPKLNTLAIVSCNDVKWIDFMTYCHSLNLIHFECQLSELRIENNWVLLEKTLLGLLSIAQRSLKKLHISNILDMGQRTFNYIFINIPNLEHLHISHSCYSGSPYAYYINNKTHSNLTYLNIQQDVVGLSKVSVKQKLSYEADMAKLQHQVSFLQTRSSLGGSGIHPFYGTKLKYFQLYDDDCGLYRRHY